MAKKTHRLKQVRPQVVDGRIKAPNAPRSAGQAKNLTFSLKYLQAGNFCFSKLDMNGKAGFSKAIFRRKDFTWTQLFQESRQSLGAEKLAITAIKSSRPPHITPEMNSYYGFRYNDKLRMVGYHEDSVFYILWFDIAYRLYDH